MENARKILNADEFHKRGVTGRGVGIAFIDTGVFPHLDFCLKKNRIRHFEDFINGKKTPYDDNGHGTFIAGAACASGVVSGGKYRGVAPEADLIALKAMNRDGEAGALRILEAMQWVFDNHAEFGIRAVCMSFGSAPLEKRDPLRQGAEALWKKGLFVAAAAGNSGPAYGTVKSPGVSADIVTVGGVCLCGGGADGAERMDGTGGAGERGDGDNGEHGEQGRENNGRGISVRNGFNGGEARLFVPDFSSRGPSGNFYKPDVVAPACGVVCGCQKNFYAPVSGTSVAAPMIAGVAALMLQKENLTPDELKARLLSSAVKIDCDRNGSGYGVPDCGKLIGQE